MAFDSSGLLWLLCFGLSMAVDVAENKNWVCCSEAILAVNARTKKDACISMSIHRGV